MSVMESAIPSTEAMTTHEAVWNEARVESSMAQLQEMHARLCNLRDTVSRLVDPMLIQQTSPEELYHGFSSNVIRTQTDVQKFAELARSDRSKEIFKRAAESRAQNSEDIRGWRVTEHEDWLDIPGADVLKHVRANGMSTMESNSPPKTSVEDLSAAIEHFKSSHPGADGSFDEDPNTITVTLSSPSNFHFNIAIQDEASMQSRYVVTCKGKPNIHSTILRHINTVATKLSFPDLLELLGSYGNLKKGPCSSCGRLLDRNAQFPLLRMKRSTEYDERQTDLNWRPYHSGCV